MTSQSIRNNWALYLAVTLACVGAFFGLSNGLSRLHLRWLDEYSYSHGYLILVMSAWLAVVSLRKKSAPTIKPSLLGWLGLVLAVAAYTIADMTYLTIGMQIMIPALLICMIAAIGGLEIAKKLVIPIGFLYFAIPIWDIAIGPLQLMATGVATTVLSLFQITAYIEGSVIATPAGTFEIGDACAGLRFFIVGLSLATFYGVTTYHTWSARIALCVVTVVISVFSNWVRVVSLIMIGHYTNMEHYLIREEHYLYGWVIFAVAMIPVFWFANRLERRPDIRGRDSLTTTEDQRITSDAMLLASGAFAAALLASPIAMQATVESSDIPVELNLQVANSNWELVSSDSWTPRFLTPDELLQTTLLGPDGHRVDILLTRYLVQKQDAKLISTRNQLDHGWQRLGNRRLEVPFGRGSLEVNQLELLRGGERRLVWYWYYVGGVKVLDQRLAKLHEAIAILRGRRDAALVAVSAACDVDCNEAHTTMVAFLAEFFEHVRAVAVVEGTG